MSLSPSSPWNHDEENRRKPVSWLALPIVSCKPRKCNKSQTRRPSSSFFCGPKRYTLGSIYFIVSKTSERVRQSGHAKYYITSSSSPAVTGGWRHAGKLATVAALRCAAHAEDHHTSLAHPGRIIGELPSGREGRVLANMPVASECQSQILHLYT